MNVNTNSLARHKGLLYGIVMAVFCLLFQQVGAQKTRFDHLTIDEGLSNGRVTAFVQDSIGFIWIGTNDGLNRFNGNAFKNYPHNPLDTTSVISNTIQDFLSDGQNLWVGTNKGIDYYNAQKDVFLHIPILGYKTSIAVDKIYKDFNGCILIATHKGIFNYNRAHQQFENTFFSAKKFEQFNTTQVTAISQDRDSIYWIGTEFYGLYKYNDRTKEVTAVQHIANAENTLANNKIFSIYEDNHHTIWVGANEGLYAISKTSGAITRYLTDPTRTDWLPHISVNKIYEDTRNNLWLGTNKGLSKFNRKTGTFQNYFHDDFDGNSLGSNSVHCLFEDLQHNLWIGSGENGISIIKSQTIDFQNYIKSANSQTSLNYDYVLSVLEDRKGNLWIGTNGRGVNKLNSASKQFTYFMPPSATQSGIQAAAITCFFEDRDGKIWIGIYLGGVAVYDPKTNTFENMAYSKYKPGQLNNNVVNWIAQDDNGLIWIATNGGGVNIYNPLTKTFTYLRSGKLSSDFCTFLLQDRSKNMWIGTYNGLNRYNPANGDVKAFVKSDNKGSISSDVVFSVFQDSKNQIWVGTDYGLNQYNAKTNKFTVYTIEDGLPNNVINGVSEDTRGNLWLSTNKGISRFSAKAKSFTNYDRRDGLASTNFYHGAYCRNANGVLYFAGSNGVTYFNPDRIKHSKYKTPLVFTDLYIYNREVSPKTYPDVLKKCIYSAEKVTLNHNQSFISINFAALNFINPNKDMYSYFLDGFDRQWNNIGNNHTASYTNLPAGDYTFYVKVVNENGTEFQKILKISVTPEWYKTIWAKIVYFLLIIFLIYFIYSYFHSRTVYHHKLLIERLEKEKAIEFNQAKIRFFINVSHEFKTPLTLIISPLEKLISSAKLLTEEEQHGLYHLIYRNTLRLSRLINQIMDLRKIDTGNIKMYVTNNDIVAFVYEIALSFEEYAKSHSIDFAVETKLDTLNVWFDIDKIEKVLYNLLSNSFRYTSDGKSIKIVVETTDENNIVNTENGNTIRKFVKISVIDQGRGIPEEQLEKIFTRFYQVQTETLANPASSGVGLSIAKEFMEMHKGTIEVKSKVKLGSEFSVFLPLGADHFSKDDLAQEESMLHPPSKIEHNQPDAETANDEAAGVADVPLSRKRYKILIVEDNYELRTFLCDSLRYKYNVLEASNGKVALDIIKDQYPDIVVSDVMMPLMNGVELCRAIKSELKTSHIPVVLLTVLNSIQNQVEGFEIGADDYITKPFHLNLLEARIFSLIETRKKLIKKFVEEFKPDPKKYTQTTLDEKFINKAVDVVEKNLSNIEFSAEDFADQAGMSRSNLHIKLKALTNQSATEFIRLIRLKKAAELLSVNQYNISEVSYMVGFNSISYFNRCFKQQFGLTPSEFMEKSPLTPNA